MPALKVNPDGSPHVHMWIRGFKADGKKDHKNYICGHPDCNSKQNKYDLIGKRSICSACGIKEIILTYDDLKRSRPKCLECSTSIIAESIKNKKSILEGLGIK